MAFTLAVVTQGAAAVLALALAAWILVLRFDDIVAQSFALLLFLRALASAGAVAINLQPNTAVALLGFRLVQYPEIALLPVLALFLALYARRRGHRVPSWIVALALVGLVLVEVAYAIDHCLAQCIDAPGSAAAPVGPLDTVRTAASLAYGLAAILLAWWARQEPEGHARDGSHALAAALLLNAAFDGSIGLATLARGGVPSAAGVWARADALILVAALVAALAAFAIILRDTREPAQRHKGRTLAGFVVASLASGVFVVAAGAPSATVLVYGMWRSMIPLLATYALLRHQLFGLDGGLRTAIKRGFGPGLVLPIFFVFTQLTQNILTDALGIVVGGIAAGLCLFALAPLQRVGERLAANVLPHAKRASQLTREESLSIYRSQAALAWADGVLDARERALLSKLRDKLGVALQDAVAIEEETAIAPLAA